MSQPTARTETTPMDDLEALREELDQADWLGDAEPSTAAPASP